MIQWSSIVPGRQEQDSTVLPVFMPPPVKCYVGDALKSTSLLGHKALRMFYSYFMNLGTIRVSGILGYFEPLFWVSPIAPIFQTVVSPSIAALTSGNIPFLIRNWLKRGYYINAFVNEPVLGCTQLCDSKPLIHGSIIYGYSGSTVHLMNYDKSRHFDVLNVGFSDLIRACGESIVDAVHNAHWIDSTLANDFPRFSLYSPQALLRATNHHTPDTESNESRDVPPELFVLKVKSSLQMYLSCTITPEMRFEYSGVTGDSIVGAEVYDRVVLSLDARSKGHLDPRVFLVLYEHKALWASLIEYLIGDGLLRWHKDLDQYRAVHESAHIARLLALKYNVTRDTELLSRICDHLITMKEMEQKVFSCVLSNLISDRGREETT